MAGAGSFVSGFVFSRLGWRELVLVVVGVMALAAVFVAASLALAKGPKGDAPPPRTEAEDPAYSPLEGGDSAGEERGGPGK